jgi:4-aminobutyrate aminotransferase-like enzyme
MSSLAGAGDDRSTGLLAQRLRAAGTYAGDGSGSIIGDRPTNGIRSGAATFVRQYCLDKGVLLGAGRNVARVLRVQPPLVIGEAQLSTVLGTIAGGIEAAAKSPASEMR